MARRKNRRELVSSRHGCVGGVSDLVEKLDHHISSRNYCQASRLGLPASNPGWTSPRATALEARLKLKVAESRVLESSIRSFSMHMSRATFWG